jgi:hypothetical protein
MHRRCAEGTCSFAADMARAWIALAPAVAFMTFPPKRFAHSFTLPLPRKRALAAWRACRLGR